MEGGKDLTESGYQITERSRCHHHVIDCAENSEGRKQLYWDTVAGLVKGDGTNASVDKQDCVFKRGGMCMMHGVMGLKYKETTQEWTKKKNGIF